MKKILAIALVLVLALSLCACGGETTKNTDPVNQGSNQQDTSDPNTPSGYTFTYKKAQLWIGMDGTQPLATLGEPKDRAVTESCAFSGHDIIYDYQSVKISTNDEKGYEMVYCIELVDDMAQTEEGIKIGSAADGVKEAYGTPTTENPNGLVYAKDGMELRFLLTDGKVSSIQYLLPGAA